jgi:hypothetical protein
MEGVPTNALAEWKARKEQEAGVAALAAAAISKRPRHRYTVVPEADLMAALEQHKVLMARRRALEAQQAQGGFPPGVPPFPPPASVAEMRRCGARVIADKQIPWHAPTNAPARSRPAVPGLDAAHAPPVPRCAYRRTHAPLPSRQRRCPRCTWRVAARPSPGLCCSCIHCTRTHIHTIRTRRRGRPCAKRRRVLARQRRYACRETCTPATIPVYLARGNNGAEA